jgi:hypothetical protein
VERAEIREVLGVRLPVARVEDVLADIARLLERYPALREQVPADVLARLV